MKHKKIYSIAQVKAHGKLMQIRFKDRTIRFEYLDKNLGWQSSSVPQWCENTEYRIKPEDDGI